MEDPKQRKLPDFFFLDEIASPPVVQTSSAKKKPSVKEGGDTGGMFISAVDADDDFVHGTLPGDDGKCATPPWEFPSSYGLRPSCVPKLHQATGVTWMVERETNRVKGCLGGIFMDEAGLGKTLTTFLLMKARPTPKGKPTLIVAPASLIKMWAQEAHTHFNLDAFRIFTYYGDQRMGVDVDKIFEKYDVILTAYSTIVSEYDPDEKKFRQLVTVEDIDENGKIRKTKQKKKSLFDQTLPDGGFQSRFGRIILDEAHHIKNHNSTMTSKAVRELLVSGAFIGSDYLGIQTQSGGWSGACWCLTATPIHNKIDDLYPIFDFLKVHPFADNYELWKQNIVTPITKDSIAGINKLKSYLSAITLRRTKGILDLPKMTDFRDELNLSELETEFYFALFDYCQERVKKLLKFMDKMKLEKGLHPTGKKGDRRTTLYSSMLTLVLRLRQACFSPLLVIRSMKRLQSIADRKLKEEGLDRVSDDEDSDMPEELRHMSIDDIKCAIARLKYYTSSPKSAQGGEKPAYSECSICLDDDANYSSIPCAHCLCKKCSHKLLENEGPGGQPACPICRRKIISFEPIEASIEHLNAVVNDFQHGEIKTIEDMSKPFEEAPSTKIKYVIERMGKDLTKKRIIVSQWTKALDLMQEAVRKTYPDLQFCRLDGSSTPYKRSEIISQFQKNDDIKLCLISLSACAEGVTMTSASEVWHLDPWWNEAKDYQVSNRIHRIGQTKEVEIHRLFARDTIEEKMEVLRSKKRKISQVTVEGKKVDENMSWVNDVKLMFNLNEESQKRAKLKGEDFC